ncbi:MAG TPA: metallophosphoesterase [Puia sp.]|nr:metallophosphoesterase [Puia sp.]
MILQYCSDLHLEFPDNRHFLAARPLLPRARILLLAGDIVPFSELPARAAFFDALSANFRRIYWIPGNHEYYGSDASKRSGSFVEAIRPNLYLLNNTVIEEGDVRLIFSTLWTHITPRFESEIENGLNDFHVIRYGNRRLRAADVNRLHAESLAFLKGELAPPETATGATGTATGATGTAATIAAAAGQATTSTAATPTTTTPTTPRKTVVITHHVPTLFHYPDVYRGSVLNEAFAVELHPLIHDSGVSHWIFGHHHFNIADFKIGSTTLTTNQLGYVKNNEQRGFGPDRTIEV